MCKYADVAVCNPDQELVVVAIVVVNALVRSNVIVAVVPAAVPAVVAVVLWTSTLGYVFRYRCQHFRPSNCTA